MDFDLSDDQEALRDAAAAGGVPAENIWIYDDREALAVSLVRRLRPHLTSVHSVDVALCVPFTVLADLAEYIIDRDAGGITQRNAGESFHNDVVRGN